jgi:hypothetical protein|tara:strand:+ start:60 stop:275 length:216 start_codon:yes stop_codon:yes gene_type:complete
MNEFYNYVFSFYNEVDGIYPIDGLTKDMIVKATNKYLTSQKENYTWGDGDSLDRERVRDIIIEDNELVFQH